MFQPPSPQVGVVSGVVNFDSAQIGGVLDVIGVKFLGAPFDKHGLSATGASIKALLTALFTQDASFTDDAVENLAGAQVGFIFDSAASWPKPASSTSGN